MQVFLFRQMANKKQRACMSTGITQVILFESALPRMVLSVKNSDFIFYKFWGVRACDFLFLFNHALWVIIGLFAKAIKIGLNVFHFHNKRPARTGCFTIMAQPATAFVDHVLFLFAKLDFLCSESNCSSNSCPLSEISDSRRFTGIWSLPFCWWFCNIFE